MGVKRSQTRRINNYNYFLVSETAAAIILLAILHYHISIVFLEQLKSPHFFHKVSRQKYAYFNIGFWEHIIENHGLFIVI